MRCPLQRFSVSSLNVALIVESFTSYVLSFHELESWNDSARVLRACFESGKPPEPSWHGNETQSRRRRAGRDSPDEKRRGEQKTASESTESRTTDCCVFYFNTFPSAVQLPRLLDLAVGFQMTEHGDRAQKAHKERKVLAEEPEQSPRVT